MAGDTTVPEHAPLNGLPPRQRILRAAGLLFEQSHTPDISTRDVQRLAGVTAPTLYHHFKDKAGLIEAVIEDAFARYLAEKRTATVGFSPLKALRAGWDMHLEFGISQPVLYSLMYAPLKGQRETPAARTAREELRSGLVALHDAGLLVSRCMKRSPCWRRQRPASPSSSSAAAATPTHPMHAG
ncbi:TetR/AcrR family transcriptional regulator [Streptomyces shenzhenensis]|uniref:TetR/AcrR family transcriptional regulator n=1 Tax=Streptomyces shenzhenensis TaxID=943815 RepID=UPI0036A1B6A0